MSLLDGGKKSALPSMSWDSVVKRGVAPPAPVTPASDGAADPPDADASPNPPSSVPPPPTFTAEPLSSDSGDTGQPSFLQSAAAPAPAPPAPAESFPPTPPAPAPPGPVASPSAPSAPADWTAPPAPAPPQPAAPAPAPPQPAAPVPDWTATSAPSIVDPAPTRPPTRLPDPVEHDDDVPAIVQATPDVTADDRPPVVGEPTGDVPVIVEATPVEASEAAAPVIAPAPAVPVVPAAPATGFALPSEPPTSMMHEAAQPDPSRRAGRKKKKKKKSGGALGLILILFVLVGLIVAGIVFGRPYLFPDDWDASAKSYAENIEAIRGVEFVEPLVVVSEPTEAYRTRVGDQLLGDWETAMPRWRALGLAAGGTEREVLDELIAERAPAIYSETDGQVYHDAALPGVDLDAHVTLAMAMAAIDQEFVVTPSAGRRSLLDEAMVDAHLLQQATAIQEASDAPTAIRPANDAPLAFLPPVLDYQIVAPTVFAELLPTLDDVSANPLDGVTADGPGPLRAMRLEGTGSPTLLPDETTLGTPATMGRSFWYLSFGAHLDGDVAWRMANSLQGNSITEVRLVGATCFYSVFTTVDSATAASLAGDLASWVGAAAPELQASVTTLEDGSVQLRTCDPGDDFTSNARFGVARDLIARQATELAAISAVIDAGGDQVAIDVALTTLEASGVADVVVALDPTISATEMASTARDVVAPIVAAPAAAAPVESVDVQPEPQLQDS